MGLFNKKLKIGDIVKIRKTGATGTILNIHPNPFLPDWLVTPNYSVDVSITNFDFDIYKRSELKFISRPKTTNGNTVT